MKKIKYKGKSGEQRPKKKKKVKRIDEGYQKYLLRRNESIKVERQCSTPSASEMRIIEILLRHGVRYTREADFPDLINPATQAPLFFDFYLPTYHAVIEFDGPHHSRPVYGKARLKTQKRRDKLKDQYCEQWQIPMLRIPYWCSDPEVWIRRFLDKFC